MKPVLLLPFLACAPILLAQNASPPPAPAPAPAKLTDAQVSNVLSQLQELEKSILAQRNSNLSSILAKLNDAISSDQAAVKFYTDCDVLVNSERKEGTKAEARQRAEQIERAMDRSKTKGGGGGGGGASDDEGEMGLALRLGLRYLILTLEAHEAKDEDFKKMAPKLQSYIQDLVVSAPKLKGRAMNNLIRVGGNGSPVVEAFQLDRFLNRPHWSRSPVDFGSIYQQTLFYIAEEEQAKDSLPGLYDSRINSEAAFRKEQMPAPEYTLWLQNEFPALRWERAAYLYKKGSSPIQAMGDMLKVIKEFPGHADAPKWVAELRSVVNESSAVPASSAADTPGTN
jgi:hypothetical protein